MHAVSAVITTPGPSIAGMSYTLNCSLNGYTGDISSANFKWLDDHMHLLGELYTHEFNILHQSDNGTYTCVINIENVTVFQTINLSVKGNSMHIIVHAMHVSISYSSKDISECQGSIKFKNTRTII